MVYERRSQALISRNEWLQRVAGSLRQAAAIIGGALLCGVLGYHWLGGLAWVDSLLEASMILSGMGPVAPMHNDAVKIFASLYALASGCVVLTCAGIVLAPVYHRFLHQFHHEPR